MVVADFGVGMDGAEPSSEVADSVVAEIEAAGGTALAVAGDVSTMEGGAAPVQAAVDTYGSIDGVVCVAGILRERMLFNMSEDEFDAVVRAHLKGTFTVFRAASAIMRKQESGSLISFTSGVWSMGSVAQANYAAAKGGIVSLTYSAAVGMSHYGVTANCIAPVARTRMSAKVPYGPRRDRRPEDVAPMVVYLLSDQARRSPVRSTRWWGKIAVWNQPEEVRAMYKDGRWTPEEIAETLPGTVGTERLKMFDMIEASRKAAAAARSRTADGPADRCLDRRGRGLPGRGPGLVDGQHRRRVRHRPGPRRSGRRRARLRRPRPLGAAARRGRLDLRRLADRARRPRGHPRPAGHLARGVRPGRGPGRVGHIGEGLLGPTLIAFGTEEQQARFLPGIVAGEELWCQGYSEPNAGSDLANVQTRAALDGDEWVINGQKVWTSLAHVVAVVLRAGPHRPDAPKHQGLSFLLVPDGPGRHRGPADRADHRQLRVQRGLLRRRPHRRRPVVGEPGEGWQVAMGLLGLRAGGLDARPAGRLRPGARRRRRRSPGATARIDDPVVRQRLAAGLDRPRAHALDTACARWAQRRARPRDVDHQAVLGHLAPRPRRAGHGRARAGTPRSPTASPTS